MKALVDDINLLMPNIKDLQISLFAEHDATLIIKEMPNLQLLNNLEIEEDRRKLMRSHDQRQADQETPQIIDLEIKNQALAHHKVES